MHSKILGLWLLTLAVLASPIARASDDTDREVAALRERIAQLEQENASLRRQLALPASPTSDSEPATSRPDTVWERIEGALDMRDAQGPAWLQLEVQLDTREFDTLHVMGSAPAPFGTTLFGFVDFESPDGGPDDSRVDASEFFYELDLRRPFWVAPSRGDTGWGEVGWVLEINDSQGTKNSLARAGIYYAPSWSFLRDYAATLYFKGFPLESDGSGHQWSVAWSKSFPDGPLERISLAGFVDVNVDSGARQSHTHIVSDTQIRYHLTPGLRLLAELRYNEFLSGNEDLGLGLGIQLRF